jgi:hypothetical protein
VCIVGVVLVIGVACGQPPSVSSSPPAPSQRVAATTTTVPRGVVLASAEPMPAPQSAALQALAPDGPTRLPPGAVMQMHSPGGRAAYDETNIDRLKAQLHEARSSALRLMRRSHLESAGYYLGSYFVPGVGVHYIDWRRVGAKFDPAHPAMLLIDATPGHQTRLAGFSYWLRTTRPPAGFSGDGDVWHQHRGMCFVDGMLASDGVASARDCDGTWVNGHDLWMLHVWIVPGYPNDAGMFAEQNDALCPARVGPETSWC